MHFPKRGGWLRLSACTMCLLGALPLVAIAQVRRPVPTAPSAPGGKPTRTVPKLRSELIIGGSYNTLDTANATDGKLPMLLVGYRRQFRAEWLSLGGTLEVGRTSIDGQFFPYEKRRAGDSLQFVAVDGTAKIAAGRLTADALFPLGDEERVFGGVGVNAGLYAVMPSPAPVAGSGTFVAPTFGASLVGRAEITKRFGATASAGYAWFTGFDRAKIRTSDPALQDPVFPTPFSPVPAAVKSIKGVRVAVGLTYRLGITSKPRSTR
jgi:hypothetical protein